jgi:hypothetical protein
MAETIIAPAAADPAATITPAAIPPSSLSAMFDEHFKPGGANDPATPTPATAAATPAPEAKASVEPAKPDSKLAGLGLEDEPIKAKAAPAPAPAVKDGEIPPGPKQLRDAYNKLAAETKRLETELERAKAPTNQKELEAQAAKVKAIEDRNAELQRQIEELDYFKSDDYKAKYEKPRQEAINSAVERVKSLKITQEDGTTRPATAEDFYKLVRAADGDADEMAEKFGKSAPRVMQMRESILDTIRKEESAVAEVSKTIEARKAQQSEAQASLNRELADTFNTRFNARFESLSKSPLEGWEPPADVHTQGRLLATVAFGNPDNLDGKQLAAVQSEVAARAAAWKGTAQLAQHLMGEVESLKAKLAGYEGSTPKPGQSSQPTPGKSQAKTVAEEFDSFMATNARQ